LTINLLYSAREIANGMDYLGSQTIVHRLNFLKEFPKCSRDLRADNVLASETDGQLFVKIADFGLSRKTTETYYTKSGISADPIKWSAPVRFHNQ
jgi:serine/threonine protein kinase